MRKPYTPIQMDLPASNWSSLAISLARPCQLLASRPRQEATKLPRISIATIISYPDVEIRVLRKGER